MKLSIIIVSFNTCQLLDECIYSIKNAQWTFDYEIIVVDNNSQDNTLEMLKIKYPEVRIVKNSDNKLFAKANNQGAKIANGEYLLLLNSDTIVEDDNLDKLVKYYDTLTDNVICIGPKVLNVDRSLQSQGMVGMKHFDTITKHFKLGSLLPSFIGKWLLPPGTYKFNAETPHEVNWVVGACMLCKKNLYLKVNGLNENLEFYGEEPEFGFRTNKLGFKTIYYPSVYIIHRGGGSTTQPKDNQQQLENSLRRYTVLVTETVGYRYAINTSRITRLAYQLKKLATSKLHKQKIQELIDYENRVITHLKKQLK